MNLVLSNNNLSVCFNQHPFRYHLSVDTRVDTYRLDTVSLSY